MSRERSITRLGSGSKILGRLGCVFEGRRRASTEEAYVTSALGHLSENLLLAITIPHTLFFPLEQWFDKCTSTSTTHQLMLYLCPVLPDGFIRT